METGGKFSTRNASSSTEFNVAIARIGHPSDAGDNPLTEVADQVEYKVADRVGIRVAPSPNLILREAGEAIENAPFLLAKVGGCSTGKGLVEGKNVWQNRAAHSDRIGAKGRYQ